MAVAGYRTQRRAFISYIPAWQSNRHNLYSDADSRFVDVLAISVAAASLPTISTLRPASLGAPKNRMPDLLLVVAINQ